MEQNGAGSINYLLFFFHLTFHPLIFALLMLPCLHYLGQRHPLDRKRVLVRRKAARPEKHRSTIVEKEKRKQREKSKDRRRSSLFKTVEGRSIETDLMQKWATSMENSVDSTLTYHYHQANCRVTLTEVSHTRTIARQIEEKVVLCRCIPELDCYSGKSHQDYQYNQMSLKSYSLAKSR
ncbi:uncharacterized protein LOC134842764 [Symsagittifera roscoffensis]|uniref:uncharacterized protein LOC134842764 n=1 Tax=Symsagittifera roscoffensis TaxID=84072 RepID=UPI00307C8EDB